MSAAADAVFGPDTAAGTVWFGKWRHVLGHDPKGAGKVIDAMRHLLRTGAEDIRRELARFRASRRGGLRDRLRFRGIREPGSRDVPDEAVRAELGPRRRTGRPDLPVASQARTLRPGMGRAGSEPEPQ